MASQMMYIDRTPPSYQGDAELFYSEIASFLNYLVEIVNHNASAANNSEGGE